MSLSIAVVGATGAVGREFVALLNEGRLPCRALRLLASARSAGMVLEAMGGRVPVEELTPRSLEGCDVVFFSAGAAVSRRFVPLAARSGAWVVDNSSAFRRDPDVPLVIPEINAHVLDGYAGRVIANPNCSTVIMLLALHPLREAFGVERVVVATYQAVSGAGRAAMEELREQTAAVLAGHTPRPRVFREPCAFNVFPHDSPVDPATGKNAEEDKMQAETRRIWNDAQARVAATCVRVPTWRAHAQAISVALRTPASERQVRQVLARAPGVVVMDDREAHEFPTPAKASGRDEILVGRIRPDDTLPHEPREGEIRWQGFHLFVCGDQLRKGAALNAMQIIGHVLARQGCAGAAPPA